MQHVGENRPDRDAGNGDVAVVEDDTRDRCGGRRPRRTPRRGERRREADVGREVGLDEIVGVAFLQAERQGGRGASIRIGDDGDCGLTVKGAATLAHRKRDRDIRKPVVPFVDHDRNERLRQRLADRADLIVAGVDDNLAGRALRAGRGEHRRPFEPDGIRFDDVAARARSMAERPLRLHAPLAVGRGDDR